MRQRDGPDQARGPEDERERGRVGASLKGRSDREVAHKAPRPRRPARLCLRPGQALEVFDLRRRKQVKSVYLKQYLNDAAVVVAGGEPAGQAQEEEGELRRKKAKRARRS